MLRSHRSRVLVFEPRSYILTKTTFFFSIFNVYFFISENTLQFITFPPRLALGGFPAFTTLVGPEGSVESHKKTSNIKNLENGTFILHFPCVVRLSCQTCIEVKL